MDIASIVSALGNLLQWDVVAWVLLGGSIGAVLGILPGLGSTVGLAIMLPVAIVLDPFAGIAFLLSIAAVGSLTSDYTSILFGIPGDGTSAALIMDGYPMAKSGEAGRALGASVASSTMGAVIGALALAVSIPFLRPLILMLGTPEIFALTIVGASLVGALGARTLSRGLLAAFLGFALATVGLDTKTGVERYMMGQIAFFEGIPLIPLTVGLFAVPELIELAREKQKVGEQVGRSTWAGVKQGMFEAVGKWFLVIRCSLIAILIGMVPGLGGGVSQWTAYAHGMQSSKEPEKFGKGSIDGIIAPGSANNAKDGGQMIPLIGFGIPGGTTSAVLLGGLLILGITPGPELVGERADISIFMVLILSVSTVIFGVLSLPILGPLARLASMPPGVAIPVVGGLLYVSVFAERGLLIDGVVALSIGLFGWVMMKFGWPRPALLLGFVLGARSESSLWISWSLMGLDWLRRPGVISLLLLAIFIGGSALIRQRRATPVGEVLGAEGGDHHSENLSQPSVAEASQEDVETSLKVHVARTSQLIAEVAAISVFGIGAGLAMFHFGAGFSAEAGVFPRFVAACILIFSVVTLGQILLEMFASRSHWSGWGGVREVLVSSAPRLVKPVAIILWLIGTIIVIPLVGFITSMALSMVIYLFVDRPISLPRCLVLTGAFVGVVYIVFIVLLGVRLPTGVVF